MKSIKNFLSGLKPKAKKKITNLQTKLSTAKQKFQENLAEAKSQPRSKRKSLFFGFSTVLAIFGIVVLAPLLPAIAKDIQDIPNIPNIPNNGGGPQPAPAPPPSEKMLEGMSEIAAAVCSAAVTSGSFVVGVICGLFVVILILKIQGKYVIVILKAQGK